MNLSAIESVTKGKLKSEGSNNLFELELDKIYPNPNQPRKDFGAIDELASSIEQNSLLQPIVVSKKPDGYMIISGERRYKACKSLNHKTIKAMVLKVDDKTIDELALIENIQREDLSDFEKAKFISKLWDSGNYAKKQDLAKAIGKSPSYISKALGCLKLDEAILEDLEESKKDVSLSVLEEMSRVKDKATQKQVYDKYNSGEITRDDIKEFKSREKEKTFPRESFTEEVEKDEKISHGKEKCKKIICHGFGTQNQLGTFISLSGDITGRIEVLANTHLIKYSDTQNYKITIEEIL